MAVTTASFKASFTEFATTADASVNLWLPVAQAMVDPDKWDTLADVGVSLALAHYLKTGGGGSKAGPAGILSSKAAGPVSGSYDTASVAFEGGGDFNQTGYGLKFLKLARMFGAGGLQV